MKTPFSFQNQALSLLFLLSATGQATAQSYTPAKLEVKASAVYVNKDIIIRWSPADYETWKWGNENGYRLERMRIDQPGEVLVIENIAPLPASEWGALQATNDMAKVAYKMIHEDSLEGEYLAGADFMTIFEAKKARENLYLFCMLAADRDFEVAVAAGLGYFDEDVNGDGEYIYSITPNNVPSGTELKKGMASVFFGVEYLPPPPIGLTATGYDHYTVIGWEADPKHYGGYMIERWDRGENDWIQVNTSPFLAEGGNEITYAQYRDSLALNNEPYIYRVKGCTPYGITGPVSDTVHVYGKPGPLKDAHPIIIDVEEPIAGQLKINWEFPMDLEGYIQGFEIQRSNKQEGQYVKINTDLLYETSRYFADDSPLPANYYKVVVIDKNEYRIPSVPKLAQPKDTIPPSAPESVAGVSNLSGTVKLTWPPSPEPDVKGYRVFLSNTDEGEFTQITTTWINDTVYHYGLNLNTLSEEVYFAVKAIDYRENMSAFSPICTVQRPDIVPPAPPSISSVVAEVGRVNFEWDLSSSEDVVGYEFQRKPNGGPGWGTLLSFPTNQPVFAFTDSTASFRQYWDYRLLVKDDAGLLASSKVVKSKPVDNGERYDITNFNGALTAVSGVSAVLQWDYPDDPDLIGFQVFRSLDSSDMQSHKFVAIEQGAATALGLGGDYRYALIDGDLDFSIPVQTVYTSNVATTTVVTGGTVVQNGNMVTVYPQVVNVPQNPQSGVTVTYWVMAKHFDGGYSPLSQAVVLEVD